MTDLRTAAQMALDALEWNLSTDLNNIPACTKWISTANKTMKAIRAALAQGEQKPVGWISKNNVVYPLEAKDEVHPVNELRPLYTAPPQREWQGLTDDEIWNADEIMAANSECGASFETLRELVHAISDKLKEKNI